MNVTVKKWGNSAALRIPAALLDAAGLAVDQPVSLHEENGRLIIEAIRPETYDLEQLLAGITSDNRHEGVEFGAAVGREAF
ncbi:AbrB/MazE/SpoVT family DNA-binding domain-containing protein [Paracoccus panacisoli]|uniref:AbrB/MazE/SpoVT family DNA-binding domain-containing protein n=1 Tax=Paracoccus panacisoli TaxID=1510163 RepID=A0ABV6T4V1_9RHOB